MTKQEIIERLTEKRARIGVIGLGYVGLPLAVEFAQRGFRSTGFEVDYKKSTRSTLVAPTLATSIPLSSANLLSQVHFRQTADFDQLKDCERNHYLRTDTLRKTKEPDVSYILAAAEEISSAFGVAS